MFSIFKKSEQNENEKKLIKELEEALTQNNILKFQNEELLHLWRFKTPIYKFEFK